MTDAPGCFIRNASARSAVTKSPETNSPVPVMKKQRSASPSHAMPMSARSATTRSTMSRRFRRDHVGVVRDPRLAAERKRLLAHHLHAVVLLRVVRGGNLHSALEPI